MSAPARLPPAAVEPDAPEAAAGVSRSRRAAPGDAGAAPRGPAGERRLAVYALIDEPPGGGLGSGAVGEPLRTVRCATFHVVVGERTTRVEVDAASLRRHDEVVRRIAAGVGSILPARFGQVVDDVPGLLERLSSRADELSQALDLVAGCVQMTLRVFGKAAPPSGSVEPEGSWDDLDRATADLGSRDLATPVPSDLGPGPGTRYLLARRAAADPTRGLPQVAALRQDLERVARSSRVIRHQPSPPLAEADDRSSLDDQVPRNDRSARNDTLKWSDGSGLLLTAFDLVPQQRLADYLEIVDRHRAPVQAAGRRVRISGPWPPYGFAPRVA